MEGFFFAQRSAIVGSVIFQLTTASKVERLKKMNKEKKKLGRPPKPKEPKTIVQRPINNGPPVKPEGMGRQIQVS